MKVLQTLLLALLFPTLSNAAVYECSMQFIEEVPYEDIVFVTKGHDVDVNSEIPEDLVVSRKTVNPSFRVSLAEKRISRGVNDGINGRVLRLYRIEHQLPVFRIHTDCAAGEKISCLAGFSSEREPGPSALLLNRLSGSDQSVSFARQKLVSHSVSAVVGQDETTLEISVTNVESAPSPVSSSLDRDTYASQRSTIALSLQEFTLDMAYPSINRVYDTQDRTVVKCERQ